MAETTSEVNKQTMCRVSTYWKITNVNVDVDSSEVLNISRTQKKTSDILKISNR